MPNGSLLQDQISEAEMKVASLSPSSTSAPVEAIRTAVGKSGFRMGELVSVKLEPTEFERLQQAHGGWTCGMEQRINEVGTVQKDTQDGNVWVKFGEAAPLGINPAALTRVSRQGNPTEDEKPIRSILQHACFIGDEDSVKRLASEGADLEEEENGDRPIHFAAYGNKPAILSLLISRKVDVNAQNTKKRTALHIAVDKDYFNCIRVLMESAPLLDVNIQDKDGCTAIHMALSKKNEAAIEMLLNACGADFEIKDDKGFNVLHKAAIKGATSAVKQILSKRPDLVNIQRRGGFTALHTAAMNGYTDVVKTLLNQSNCIVDLETPNRWTALMFAVREGHCDVVELLVQKRADINKPNCNGNTAMHLSLLRRSALKPERVKASTSPGVAEVIHNLHKSCEPGADISLALACFLANRGGDLDQMNGRGDSALTIAKTPAEGELLRLWNTTTWPAASQQHVATSASRIFDEITRNASSGDEDFLCNPFASSSSFVQPTRDPESTPGSCVLRPAEAAEDSGTQRAITGTHEGQQLNPISASSATPGVCDGVASRSHRNRPQGTPMSAQSTVAAEYYERRLCMQMTYERQQHELQVKLQERQLEQEDTKRRHLDEEHEMKMAILKQKLKYWEKKNSCIV